MLIGDVYRAAIFSSETQFALAPLFCQSLTLYFSMRASLLDRYVCVCVCVCVHFYFCFLLLPFLFFFIFSVTASESSRPIGVEIVEIDQPTDRLGDRSIAAHVPRVLPREIQLNTPPSHFRSHANVTRIET